MRSGKISVYHFILDHRMGGHHSYAHSLSKVLNKTGNYTFRTVTTGRGVMTDVVLVNIRHYWSVLYCLEIAINILFIMYYTGIRTIKREKAIFHVHGAANIAPVIGAYILGVPVIWHFHEIVSCFRPLVKVGLLFLRPGRSLITSVTGQTGSVYELKQEVIIGGPVDTVFWNGKSERHRLEKNRNSLNIVCTANVNPLKGQDILLKSLSGFQVPVTVTLIGAILDTQKQYYESLRQLSSELERENRLCNVEFLGLRDPRYIRNRLAECDVFVLPSRSEACPIALLEAMAMGKPCVAADVGGVRDMIANDSMGILVAPEDPEAMAEGIGRVLKMTVDERDAMGKNARKRVEKEYSLPKIADRYNALYKNLL